MRRLVCILAFMVAACTGICAQNTDDEQGWYSVSDDDNVLEVSDIESHEEFLGPLAHDTDGIFMQLSRYDLNFTSYRARGYDERLSRRYLGALDVSSSDKYPDYGFYSALSYSSVTSVEMYFHESGYPGKATEYTTDTKQARHGLSATANYSVRRYRAGIKLAGAGTFGKGNVNSYAFKAQRRWGRDAHIGGVFTDAGSVSLALDRDFRSGHTLRLFVMAAPSLQGTKSWATKEAFELTGDRWYNPSWGEFKGKELNSRMRRDMTPVVVVSYNIPYGWGRRKSYRINNRTSYTITAGYRFGERSRSGLTWFDARNPAPDYYVNMPSYFADSETAEEVARAWRSGEYTQLDWEHLWEANMLSDTTASFVLDDRVERIDNMQAALSADTRVNLRLFFRWGLRLRGQRSNHFKRVRNMLGGDYILDVDQYLIDDQYYGSKYINDVRNPGRRVGQGDRFGYDYDIRRSEASFFIGGRYSERGPWNFTFGGELAFKSLSRNGNYEKETFPGELSYGRSRRLNFTTYALDASARYSFSLNHGAWLYLMAAELEPSPDDVFLNPASHNIAADMGNMSLMSVEMRYRGFFAGFLALDVAAYFTQSRDGSETLRYYDDLYAEYSSDDLSGYSVMTMRGIDKRHAGVEVGVEIDITSRLKLSLAGAISSHTYISDPSVEIRADVNLQGRLTDGKSYLSGYIASPSPQVVFMSALTYSAPSRWRVELSWNYAGHRYVSLSPVRRTGRIAELASSPEMRTGFRTQERLPDASSLGLFVSKGFVVAGHYMYAGLSVDNILDSSIIYGGYEQSRIRKSGTGINRTYSPFPSKYSYYYPRTFYLTVSANF